MTGFRQLTAVVWYFLAVTTLAVTSFMPPEVYGSLWFSAIWVITGIMIAVGCLRSGMWRNLPAFALHLSFIIIITGGFITSSCSERGFVSLSENKTAESFTLSDGTSRPLPFTVSLDSFTIQYHPGGVAPKDFVSSIKIDGEPYVVSMNNACDFNGYRLCQSSYDSSGGTTLSISHDTAGRSVCFTGCIVFAISGLMLMIRSRGRYRKLLGKVWLLVLITCSPSVKAETVPGIPLDEAQSLRSRQVLYRGRIVTFSSLSRNFMLKIHNGKNYRGLTPEQVVASWVLFPDEWNRQPLIEVRNKLLQQKLGMSGRYISFAQLFDDKGNYRLSEFYKTAGMENLRPLEELDEKAGLIMTLLSGKFITPLPPDVIPLSREKVNAEIFYNSIPWTKVVFISLFLISAAGFIILYTHPSAFRAVTAGAVVVLAIQLSAYALQWYVTGHIPLSGTFETLEFLVIATLILALIIGFRIPLFLPTGTLLSATIALVAHLNYSNPILTPLMPVLSSPWLSIHVTLVMSAYAMLSVTFACSLYGIIRPRNAVRSMNMNLVILYPAIWLLGLGIFTGAIWADISWGRYWAWDPKETWALVTMMVYAVPLHRGITNRMSPFTFNIYTALSFLTVAMTYFGVNFLPSLHSYGN